MQINTWILVLILMMSKSIAYCRFSSIARIVLSEKYNESKYQLSLSGYYTPLSTTNSFRGRIIYGKGTNGMSDGCSNLVNSLQSEAFVVMVNSGGCSLEAKIGYAMQGNASGLIIRNYENREYESKLIVYFIRS